MNTKMHLSLNGFNQDDDEFADVDESKSYSTYAQERGRRAALSAEVVSIQDLNVPALHPCLRCAPWPAHTLC